MVADDSGAFYLPDVEPPVTLFISHPGFFGVNVKLEPSDSGPLRVVLQPRAAFEEEVTVVARLPGPRIAPIGAASSTLDAQEGSTPAGTVGELVQSVPSVAPNGQGGLFETYSIRGISRHRITTSISGIRLTSERRAGVSASFVDPFLLGSVDVVRGPASSYYGSGALGGTIDLSSRQFQDWVIESEYATQGNGYLLAGGWGSGGWSAGFARRHSGNTRAADSTELNSHFTQYSGLVSKIWEAKNRDYQLLLLPAVGRDIGKSNIDFPERTTNYPEEKHLLASFSTRSIGGWGFSAFVHPQDLHTQTVEEQTESNVFNNSFDFGLETDKEISVGARTNAQVSVDYFGRQGVDSTETRDAPETSPLGSQEFKSLDGASENDLGLRGSVTFHANSAIVEAAGRWTLINQKNGGPAAETDTAFNGFAGVVFPLRNDLELNASIGSGVRFPSLSELFFSGTTGRGTVHGNPNLEAERSLNLEGGVRYYASLFRASAYLFRNQISDYIERVEIAPDEWTFINLTEGTIDGLEWECQLLPTADTRVYGFGHFISGESMEGMPRLDIPVHRSTVGFEHFRESWASGAQVEFRGKKKDPGEGEKQIPDAQLLSAFVSVDLPANLQAALRATNLLNQLYFGTADRKAPLAQGRGFLITVRWALD
jgi:iron complex outermembrane receptor protein